MWMSTPCNVCAIKFRQHWQKIEDQAVFTSRTNKRSEGKLEYILVLVNLGSCMSWKLQLSKIWFNSIICLLEGDTHMVDMFVNTVKKLHTHALLFQLQCTLEYYLQNAASWHYVSQTTSPG